VKTAGALALYCRGTWLPFTDSARKHRRPPRGSRTITGRSRGDGPVKTGVAELDRILIGGLARDRLFLIEGTPGTGKTTLALHFLIEGARNGETCLYITLSETASELRAMAASHGWSLDGVALVELVPLEADPAKQQSLLHPSEVELGETTSLIMEKVNEIRPDRLVIDSLSELRLLAQDALSYRRQILALKHFFSEQHSTVMALDDLTDRTHSLQLHSAVHGVIALEQRQMEYGTVRRRLHVVKFRGIEFQSGYHDYVIRKGGLFVFQSLMAAAHESEPNIESVSSGIVALDALLGGGLDRGTSTLLVGPSGVGKSSLALQYVMAAANRGERAAIFAFDEGYAIARRRAAGLGMDVDSAMRRGALHWERMNPVMLSPGEFAYKVRAQVAGGARLVIIDSLNSYMGSMPEEQFLTLQMHELLSYLDSQGILTILILAQHGLVGNTETPVDLSFLSDAIILLRFFEAKGEVRKAISVLKKRSGLHEQTIREYRLCPTGVSVGEPILNFQGVLSGVPVLVGPSGIPVTTA
jgi:circadian clock protein KaiC